MNNNTIKTINEVSEAYAIANAAYLVVNAMQRKQALLNQANQTLKNVNNYDSTTPYLDFQTQADTQNGFRPKQWDDATLVFAKTNVGGYFFDAILKAEHSSTLKITEQPIQNGAAIADHAYMLPTKLVLEIGMSDVMDCVIDGQFGSSKSIGAYNVLLGLQENITLLNITTRLTNYSNMLIENISAADDAKTLNGLRCNVVFKQVMVSDVYQSLVSSRVQVSTPSQLTAQQPLATDSTIAYKLEQLAQGK